ncbi:SulP family inorganic anion transporter [Pontibacter sp. G13]|uniref:SulP family inorganic anion transporter n=1 Tax=Pontibacter sp. G13 TaxID=3074898 RepID=UPI00288A8473|nr:SulP family inorganic anion transporter [Pontibacter sp. G13]WNJ18450.1 SulP family inorganic anion transporter [Pontibacter sp. G13]
MTYTFIDRQRGNIKDEILSGLTVAIALVPEAIAFAIIAGVDPKIGLFSAFMMGIITSLLGGRPGMITGATGAVAVVVAPLIADSGVEYLFPTIMMAGVLQMAFGWLKLGRFIRMIPHSVMLGFVNGLAIVIFLAQFSQFKDKAGDALEGTGLLVFWGLIALTMGIMFFLPKLTKAVPSALTAIVVGSVLAMFFFNDTILISDQADMTTMSEGLFSPFFMLFPSSELLNIDTFWIILPFALKVAGVGLIESLLTLTLVDEITDTRGDGNRESVAQGIANFATGFFGGMGGCAMIGQTMININSGARARLSSFTAAVFLLSFMLILGQIIGMIPIAVLVGVMFMVAIGTFEWSSLRVLNKIPPMDVFVIIAVSVITVFEDLAVAVLIGVILSALAFAWENALRIRARKRIDEHGVKHYEIYGPLFFASTTAFMSKFEIQDDPQSVIIDFKESRVADQSAIEAINKIAEKYEQAGKTVHLLHLSQDCVKLIKRAEKICKVNVLEDPDYFVAIKDYESALAKKQA